MTYVDDVLVQGSTRAVRRVIDSMLRNGRPQSSQMNEGEPDLDGFSLVTDLED